MTAPPEPAESRERWRAALAVHEARRERIRRLRTELAECRRIGLAARHAQRLRRARATTEERNR